MKTATYAETTALMLEIVPDVFAAGDFAMKGGTALNVFVRDLPRLSVDIDVVFLPWQLSRADALAAMNRNLDGVAKRLRTRGIETDVSGKPEDTKLFARRGLVEVKVEVNHVFRGSILPHVRRVPSPHVLKQFPHVASVDTPTLAVSELYGSKVVAALDRQHPRDLFDVRLMFEHEGMKPDIVETFVGYLAGHNRPVHEVLFSRDVPLNETFVREFQGMARESVSIEQLLEARSRLRRELLAALTENHKQFLLGLVRCEPPWSVMQCPHLARLPAIKWKLQNLDNLKTRQAAKWRVQYDALKAEFGA